MKISETINNLLIDASMKRVSDIHFQPNEKNINIYYRVKNDIIKQKEINQTEYKMILRYIKYKSRLDISQTQLPQDGSFSIKDKDQKIYLRISTIPLIENESLVIRLLYDEVKMKLKEISLIQEDFENMYQTIKTENGLFVFTGPTGSGKSTSMHAILERLSNEENKKIICIENPVEVINKNFIQIQINDDSDMRYTHAIRASLRHDPDIIMIGEIRDEETARIVFRAALTGHTVISTMHTKNKYGVIERFIDFGFLKSEIHSVLIGISNQRLILNKEGKIKTIYDYSVSADLIKMINHGEENDIYDKIKELKEKNIL